ncbi:transposase [Nocardia amamiensis]|uniref:transposase n=1 Tax=Nocardia amamiensis TaxID=404578 RepID=UPI001471F4F1|nr:transposase [Nocardia amamiensis]
MSKRYPPEVREKAVRLALERLDEYGSPYAAAQAIAPMVDVHYETLRIWIKKALDEGARPGKQAASGLSSAERDELTRLRKENRALKQANAILKLASLDSTGPMQRCWWSEGLWRGLGGRGCRRR